MNVRPFAATFWAAMCARAVTGSFSQSSRPRDAEVDLEHGGALLIRDLLPPRLAELERVCVVDQEFTGEPNSFGLGLLLVRQICAILVNPTALTMNVEVEAGHGLTSMAR